jgi:DNA-binding MarR family transcriptional regulator
MRSLPGWAIDALTDGLPDALITRGHVIKELRRIMCSMHRAEWPYANAHNVLADTTTYRFAQQLATSDKGRTVTQATTNKTIRQHWNDTHKVVANRPAWSKDEAIEIVDAVTTAFYATADLPATHHLVMSHILDLAAEKQTTKVTVPTREIATRAALSRSTAHRTITELANAGEWIALVRRGNYKTRKANVYRIAPHIVNLWGVTPPKSHAYLSPTHLSPNFEGVEMSNPVTLTVQARDIQHLMEVLTSQGVTVDPQQLPANVVPIRKDAP